MQALKKDSRYRFRYIESKKDSDSSELEDDIDVCIFLLSNVKYAKPEPSRIKKRTSPFSEFYTVLNTCRRESRKKAAADLEAQMASKA